MSSHVFIALLLSNFLIGIQAQNRITIDMGENGSIKTDLQSYLSDLHVAVTSVQYTANMSARMLIELMDKLKRDEVKCQCTSDEIPRSVGAQSYNNKSSSSSSSDGRLDYRRTSPSVAHKLHTWPLKWNDARKSCRLEGAELATIQSIDEAQLLAKLLDEARHWSQDVNATESAFMGIHNYFEANDWITLKGEAVPASWSVDVSNATSSHRCAVLTVHSKLAAVDCNQSRPYLCELRLPAAR